MLGLAAVMQHSEVDRTLGIEAEATVSQMAAQHVTATDLDPEPAEHQIRPSAPRSGSNQW